MVSALFLPGVIAPASLRYEPLGRALGADVHVILKDLEVCVADGPPSGYSIATEVQGVARAADAAGLERFHLYGHSAGGAIALAFAAAYPLRLLSLALDEPADDFLGDHGDEDWHHLKHAASLEDPEAMRAFMRLQLGHAEPLPPPPVGPPPPWMKKRPAGIRAFLAAVESHHLDVSDYRAFRAPVYYSYGTGSHPRWSVMRDRLNELFEDFTVDRYDGLHHLNTSHQAQPARVAAALRALWSRSR